MGWMAFAFRKELQYTFSKELQYGIKHNFSDNINGHGGHRMAEIWDKIQTQVSNLELYCYSFFHVSHEYNNIAWFIDFIIFNS